MGRATVDKMLEQERSNARARSQARAKGDVIMPKMEKTAAADGMTRVSPTKTPTSAMSRPGPSANASPRAVAATSKPKPNRVDSATRRGGKPMTNTGTSKAKPRGVLSKMGEYFRSQRGATEATRKKLGIT